MKVPKPFYIIIGTILIILIIIMLMAIFINIATIQGD